MPAVRAADPRQAVGKDAAAEAGTARSMVAEVALHPGGDAQPMGSAYCASTRKVSRWLDTG